MTTFDFINVLEQEGVIDVDLARQMRSKAEEGGARVTPDAILKFLVKTDVITAWKAEELGAMVVSAARREDPEVLDLMPLPEGEDSNVLSDWDDGMPPIRAASTPPAPFDSPSIGGDEPPMFSSKAVRLGDPPPPSSLGAEFETEGGRPAKGVFKLEKGKAKKGKKRTAGGKNQWDSPLLLLGGGALAVLLVGGAILYYLLIRENADAVLADANNLFERGAYRQASARYEDFVAKFPRHQNASEARVRGEMSKLWDAAEGDAAGALPEAQRVIGEIEDEVAFTTGAEGQDGPSTAKQELGTILVRIGKALVQKAEAASPSQEDVTKVIEQLDAVLALSANEKYLPQQYRNEAELASIAESLEVIRSRQQRDARLEAALAKMDEAIAAGDTSKAYQERLALLADYPAVADDPALIKRVRDASATEQARIKFVAKSQVAESAWPPREVVAELALAERLSGRKGQGAGSETGQPVVVRVDGALYGLRSGDGSLLWRRFAGMGSAGVPLMLDGDVVAADLGGGELWRLNAETGKLVWRLLLGDQISGVIAVGPRLLATSASGKMYVVETRSGALVGHVEFAQPIRTVPVVNDRGDRIYVAAEHSILYTLAAEDLSCLGVYYSGHAAGAICAPPVSVLNKLIVADNSGTETCRLRVLSVDSNGVIDGEVAGERLDGLVLTPLARAARRLAAATTVGQLAVADISGANDASSLSIVARRDGHEAQPLARFALIHEGRLWLAATQLTALDIVPTESQLSVRSLDQDFDGDSFDDVLRGFGPLVIHVRRPAGRAGVIVAATDANTNSVAWQTELAVPLAGVPAVDAMRLRVSAITASGAAFILERDDLARGVQDEAERPDVSLAGEPPLTTSVDLGKGRTAAGAIGGKRLVLASAEDEPQRVRAVDLAGPLSCQLTTWNGRLVVATEEGRVATHDPMTGVMDGAPFLPSLTPGQKFHWLAPATADGTDEAQLLISDGERSLFSLARQSKPTPHLAAAHVVDVGPAPLVSPLAVLGKHVVAGMADGRLAAYLLPELKPQEPLDVGGRIVWGPHPIADGVLFATDADELLFVDAQLQVQWRTALKRGPCGGRPLEDKGFAWVLNLAGSLSRIDLTSGEEAAAVELGQPAVAGPVALGPRFIVAAPDGALVVVNRP